MNEHPHEHLAEYVDGALSAPERAGVEAHLDGCDTCREEVALAREARRALSGVSEVPVPLGTTERVIHRARQGGRWDRPGAWIASGAAAAAAIVLAFALVGGSPTRLEDAAAPPSEVAEEAAEAPATDEAADAGIQTQEGQALRATRYPELRIAAQEYTPQMLTETTRALADEARTALEEGFPATAAAFYQAFDLRDLPPAARRILQCATQGVPPDRTVVPFVLEEAHLDDEPVYLVAFLRGPDPETGFDRLQVLVVDRETCTARHFAHQRL